MNQAEELYELRQEVVLLRARVKKLKRQRNLARLRRDEVRKQRDQMSVYSISPRTIQLQLTALGAGKQIPITSRCVSLTPGSATSVELDGYVRPANPELGGYFTTMNLIVKVMS